MRPDDRASDLPAPSPSRSVVGASGSVEDDTKGMPRVVAAAPVASAVLTPPAGTPPELAGMLLPTEAVTFASSPHWIIFVRPAIHVVAILVLLGIALSWQLHPIVRGHHVTVFLLTGVARTAALVFAALLLLREAFSVLGRVMRYFGSFHHVVRPACVFE